MAKMFPKSRNSEVIDSKFSHNGSLFADQFVDIIIPFHGCYDKVAKLITSLLYQTRSNQFRICLVDDCSPNDDFIVDAFSQVPNLKQIRNKERKGFGASLEIGAKALDKEPSGVFPWLVFMHSDCVIEESKWLINMGQSMLELKKQGIKMIGNLTNNPVIEDERFICSRRDFKERKLEGQGTDIILENDDYLPMHCVMCHRDLFRHVGGFVKHYPMKGYEDREFASRMRFYGYKQAICGSSWIHHDGSATLNWMRSQNIKVDKQLELNKNLWTKDTENFRPKE
jgi:GT2 family glycosyltransferase